MGGERVLIGKANVIQSPLADGTDPEEGLYRVDGFWGDRLELQVTREDGDHYLRAGRDPLRMAIRNTFYIFPRTAWTRIVAADRRGLILDGLLLVLDDVIEIPRARVAFEKRDLVVIDVLAGLAIRRHELYDSLTSIARRRCQMPCRDEVAEPTK